MQLVTTLAAFTPLLLAKGGTADFTRGIPVMIMLTLTVSYLLVIPAVCRLALKAPAPPRPVNADAASRPDGEGLESDDAR